MILRRLRRPHQRGRTPHKGKRRPTPEQVLANPKTKWTKLEIEDWYGEGKREVEIHSQTAVWYHPGKPPVEIRWVLIRDPREEFEPQALLSTNLEHTPAADSDLVHPALAAGSDL